MTTTAPAYAATSKAQDYGRQAREAGRVLFRNARGPLLESAAAFLGAVWMLVATRTVFVFVPLDRTSQVSGLAALQVRFLAAALPGLLLLVLAARVARVRPWAVRIAFPLLPGLLSGFVAGGVMLALRGVDMPLNGTLGDAGDMERWTMMLQSGQMTHPGYPPLFPRFVWFVALFTGHNVFLALKYAEILTTAVLGPAVYLAWRLVLGRTWSCTIAVLYTAALVEPYKSYEPLVLGILIPLAVAYLRGLREPGRRGEADPAPVRRRRRRRDRRRAALVGAAWGLGFGELFLLFSGPFYWSAIGLTVSALTVFPYRAWREGLIMLAATAAGFLLVGWHLALGLLQEAPDPYFFFQTDQDPGYPFQYLTDLPGPLAKGVWPPVGDVGGVGLFGIVAVALAGVAVWLGARRLPVLATASVLLGAWVMRFHLAAQMYADHLVRYWPRTTSVVIYCFLILSVLAVQAVGDRVRSRLDETGADGALWARAGTGMVGFCLAATLFTGMAASAAADKYMPKNDGSPGQLAFNAQHDDPRNLRLGTTLVNGK